MHFYSICQIWIFTSNLHFVSLKSVLFQHFHPFDGDSDVDGKMLQKDGFIWPDVEILRTVGCGNVEVDGLVKHIDERFFLAFDTVDVDGRYASGNVVAADRELDVPDKKRSFGLCDRTKLPPQGVLAPQGREECQRNNKVNPRRCHLPFQCLPGPADSPEYHLACSPAPDKACSES